MNENTQTVANNSDLQLIASQESLDFALQSGRMGTWDVNIENGTVSCSQQMLDLWGITPEEFKNQRSLLQTKVHPDDVENMMAQINYAIQNNTIYELEYRIIPKPGVIRWILSRGRSTSVPGSLHPNRFAGLVYDITDRKEKEAEIAKANKARDDFFAIAGHELKTPLTCMQLQIQVMQFELKNLSQKSFNPDLIHIGLKKQQEHLSRISRIVDNILDEARITEGKLSLELNSIELTEMAASVIEQLKLTAELANVEIKFASREKVHGIWDRFRLEQVLINLLMNAIRYGNKNPIQVEVLKENATAIIRVRDSGRGIKLEDQKRIFQRFERVNPESDSTGMGLGLFISKNIVNAHGGDILMQSEYEKGSEFSVHLPIK